uniref:Uncharacterized protein n=1 Tax=Daphnia galeata TaxID=27404 RepID=A0A8J2VYQ0_9CRUS|nr:unnamed protein product [Daphnia galeata]
MDYEIGTQYKWTGKSTKGVDENKFVDLKNIFAAISGAVLGDNDITANEKTTIIIQFQVSEWLRHCQQNISPY